MDAPEPPSYLAQRGHQDAAAKVKLPVDTFPFKSVHHFPFIGQCYYITISLRTPTLLSCRWLNVDSKVTSSISVANPPWGNTHSVRLGSQFQSLAGKCFIHVWYISITFPSLARFHPTNFKLLMLNRLARLRLFDEKVFYWLLFFFWLFVIVALFLTICFYDIVCCSFVVNGSIETDLVLLDR